jgi:multiple sugar transport system permease protein
MLAYDFLIRRLDMGVGSAMSVLVFLMVLGTAFVFVKVLGAAPDGAQEAKVR